MRRLWVRLPPDPPDFMKKLHRKDQGSVGEALVIAQVLSYHLAVFPEFGDNSRIDLIVEDSARSLHKVQVKTLTRTKEDVTRLLLYKSGPNYQFLYTADMIDWFAIVDYQSKRIAWIDAIEAFNFSDKSISFRHSPAKNNQVSGTRLFSDYERFPFK